MLASLSASPPLFWGFLAVVFLAGVVIGTVFMVTAISRGMAVIAGRGLGW